MALFLALPLLLACGGGDGIRLRVDYSTRPVWNYRFSADVTGRLTEADSTRHFSNTASCLLVGEGRKGSPAALDLRFRDVTVISTLLDSAECRNLERQFEETALGIELANGVVDIFDTLAVPVVRIGEWDLVRTFVRAIPSLPGMKVVAGEGWEREKTVPLMTSLGRAAGHLYQSFVLDSVAEGGTDAWVSWRFTYRIEPLDADNASLFPLLPLAGTGTGQAHFSLAGNYLESVQVTFRVPRSHEGPDLSWEENLTLRLIDG